MTNIELLDSFLNDVYREDDIDEAYIYYFLTNYGVKEEYVAPYSQVAQLQRLLVNSDLDNGRQKIAKYLEENTKLRVLLPEDLIHDMWLSIRDLPDRREHARYKKIYFNVDKDDLEYFCCDVFKFLSDNDIHHDAKVTYRVRNDDVVIRVLDDGSMGFEKLIGHINSSEELKKCTGPTNPFLPIVNGVACIDDFDFCDDNDGAFSDTFDFNKEITNIVASYLKKAKEENLPSVSVYDLASSFLSGKFTRTDDRFKSKNMIDNLFEHIFYCPDYRFMGDTIKQSLSDMLSIPTKIYSEVPDELLIEALRTTLYDPKYPLSEENYPEDGVNALWDALEDFFENSSPNGFVRYKDGDTSIDYRKIIKSCGKIGLAEFMDRSLVENSIDPAELSKDDWIGWFIDKTLIDKQNQK